jgi:hypothetical protein
MLERRYRAVAQATVFIALSAGIGAVAYEQWSLAESLQSALYELSSAQPQPLVHQSSFDRDGFGSQPAGAARIGRRANVEPPSAERDELETRGASLVATNNLAEALSHYRMLANRFPNDRLVRDFVKVLESKQSCDGAGGPRGAACP